GVLALEGAAFALGVGDGFVGVGNRAEELDHGTVFFTLVFVDWHGEQLRPRHQIPCSGSFYFGSLRMGLNFSDRHVVVTGGTGALGTAVVQQLLDAGATCHVSCIKPEELERFEFKAHPKVKVQTGVELTDEKTVESFYAKFGSGVPLWASINVA